MYYEYGYRYLMTIWGMLTKVNILVVVFRIQKMGIVSEILREDNVCTN